MTKTPPDETNEPHVCDEYCEMSADIANAATEVLLKITLPLVENEPTLAVRALAHALGEAAGMANEDMDQVMEWINEAYEVGQASHQDHCECEHGEPEEEEDKAN